MIRRLPGGDQLDPTSRSGGRPVRRRVAALALAGVSVLTLSACQLTSPIQTMSTYDAADGMNTSVGDLSLSDLLVVADKQGGPGNVVGYAVNQSGSPIQVSISAAPQQGSQGQDQGTPVTVPANGTVQLSRPQGGQTVTLPQVQAAPGGMTQLVVSTSAGQTSIDVPVMSPSSYYQTLAPAQSGQSGAPTQGSQGGSQSPSSSDTSSTGSPSPTSTGG